MKEMMKRALAFVTFEQLSTKSQIEFKHQHFYNAYQQPSNALRLIAVRHKLIYEYWQNQVLHFCCMFLVATMVTHLAISKVTLPAVTMAGILSYSITYLFCYRFIFNFILLPNVEIIDQECEHKFGEEIRKCRKAQYSNFALVLIDNVNTDISEMISLSCNDKSASMLTELYGVDTGSMKKNLELLFMKNKRKNFTERNKTEYKNCFNEAYDYFVKRQCLQGAKKVKQIEINFFG